MTSTHIAHEGLLAQYRAFAGNGAGTQPRWIGDLRQSAIDRFSDLGFPHPRLEAWRFTNVTPIAQTPFVLATSPIADRAAIEAVVPRDVPGPSLVFVNGVFDGALSQTDDLPAGVTAGNLDTALAHDEALLRRHLAQHAIYDSNAFTALGTAFLRDLAFVHVGADVRVEHPVHLVFVAASKDDHVTIQPRALVLVDRGSQASFMEYHVAAADHTYLSTATVEAVLADNTRVEWCRVQRESPRAFHMAATHTRQARDSQFALQAFALGGRLARHDIYATLAGSGSHCALDGLYVGDGEQHFDHHTTIDHAVPHTTSHELFNGVLDDRARAVFTGRLIVRKGAQKTDAKQTNNNLLVSTAARADSQPQLEIYADDVRCTHGATLGPLDDLSMFYLRSRGLDEVTARSLLMYGFGAQILQEVESDQLREALELVVRARLHELAARPSGAAS